MRITQFTSLIASGLLSFHCIAQTPYVNLFWEANDGSGWVRNQLVTTQSSVRVRYVAEWDAPGTGAYLSDVSFDATIANTSASDDVSMIARGPTFYHFDGGYSGTLSARRFGNLVKLDSISDAAAPGAGQGWIQCAQLHDNPPIVVDRSHVISIFSYELNFAASAGTRRISSIPRISPVDGSTAYIWSNTTYRVIAVSQGVDVTFVPVPSATGFIVLAAAGCRRRR